MPWHATCLANECLHPVLINFYRVTWLGTLPDKRKYVITASRHSPTAASWSGTIAKLCLWFPCLPLHYTAIPCKSLLLPACPWSSLLVYLLFPTRPCSSLSFPARFCSSVHPSILSSLPKLSPRHARPSPPALPLFPSPAALTLPSQRPMPSLPLELPSPRPPLSALPPPPSSAEFRA